MSNPLMEELLQTVTTGVLARLKDYKGDEPAGCLHLVYYDTHAPEAYLDLAVTTDSKRAELYAEDPGDLWDGYGEPGNASLGELDESNSPVFAKVYEFLSEDGKEEENMQQYRDTLAKAALKINETIEPLPNITDDFVVVLGDGSRWTGGGDPAEVFDCLPPEKAKLLQERGLLGEDDF